MRLNSVQTVFYSFLLLTISPPIVSQTVSPGPTHDCSNQLVYIGDLACNNDLHNCCGATETCCAGGCCSLSEVCVFQGTANEACCPMGDPTFCGEPAAPKGTCPSSTASVPCSGIDSSWHCSAGCTCNVSVDNGCNCFTSCDDTPDTSSSSEVVAAPSSTTDDSTQAAASSTQVVEDFSTSETTASTQAAASSTQVVEDFSTSETAASTTDDSSPPAATSSEVLSVQTQTSIETSAAKTTQTQSQGTAGATTAGSGSGTTTTSVTAPAVTTSASGAWTIGVEQYRSLVVAFGVIFGFI